MVCIGLQMSGSPRPVSPVEEEVADRLIRDGVVPPALVRHVRVTNERGLLARWFKNRPHIQGRRWWEELYAFLNYPADDEVAHDDVPHDDGGGDEDPVATDSPRDEIGEGIDIGGPEGESEAEEALVEYREVAVQTEDAVVVEDHVEAPVVDDDPWYGPTRPYDRMRELTSFCVSVQNFKWGRFGKFTWEFKCCPGGGTGCVT